MKAILNNVIIKEIKEEKENDYGLSITLDTKNEKYKRGIVLSCGEMCEGISVNDIVWYDMHRTSRITFNGEQLTASDYGAILLVE